MWSRRRWLVQPPSHDAFLNDVSISFHHHLANSTSPCSQIIYKSDYVCAPGIHIQPAKYHFATTGCVFRQKHFLEMLMPLGFYIEHKWPFANAIS